MYIWKSEYFYGNKISEYGLKNGWVDYRTLSRAFDMVLNNNIISTSEYEYWELVNGCEYWHEDGNGNEINSNTYDELEYEEQQNYYECYSEIYQYFIISERGYEILSELTDEIIFYNEKLDMYVWGVTHWGTSWDYVLTNIKIKIEED